MAMCKLSDQELVGRLKQLASAERALLGEVLRLLREVEDRKLPQQTENPTLYKFCVVVLRFSAHEAYARIQVVRLMRSVPQVESAIEEGRIGMSVAASAQVYFRRAEKAKTPVPAEQQQKIVESLYGRSAREAEKILADIFPEAPRRDRSQNMGGGNVRVAFTISEDLFEDLQELFRIRSHVNPEKRWEKMLVDLVKLGWRKWHPLARAKRSPRTSDEAVSH